MAISENDVEAFRQLYLEDCQIDLPPGEARAVVRRVLTLFEVFAEWLSKERAAGRCLDDAPARTLRDT